MVEANFGFAGLRLGAGVGTIWGAICTTTGAFKTFE
jgi:hypothetical protein